MIVLNFSCGDHSNRLFQAIDWYCFCKEHGIEFFHNIFDKEDRREFGGRSFSYMSELYNDPIGSTDTDCDITINFDVDPNEQQMIDFKNEILQNKDKNINVVGRGACYLKHDHSKYRTELQYRYSLKGEYFINNNVYNQISHIKDTSDVVLVGVHIRRGDYKHWWNGKYYFDDDVYLSHMELIKRHFNCMGKSVHFVVCSNDNIDIIETNNITISREEWYIDQKLFSMCDLLIGPPSSFTGFASFIGDVPLYYISNSNISVDSWSDSFKMYLNYNYKNIVRFC